MYSKNYSDKVKEEVDYIGVKLRFIFFLVIAIVTVAYVYRDGLKGERGEKGAAGKDGARGPKGEDGAQGEVGPRGEDGATGAVGERGEMGPQGPKGDDGAQGVPGPRGEEGQVQSESPFQAVFRLFGFSGNN